MMTMLVESGLLRRGWWVYPTIVRREWVGAIAVRCGFALLISIWCLRCQVIGRTPRRFQISPRRVSFSSLGWISWAGGLELRDAGGWSWHWPFSMCGIDRSPRIPGNTYGEFSSALIPALEGYSGLLNSSGIHSGHLREKSDWIPTYRLNSIC